MFKWKVSGLGGKKEKSPKTTRLNNDTSIIEDNSKNNRVKENNNKKDKTRSQEDATSSPRTRGFRLFQSGGQQGPTQDTGTGTLRREDPATLSRVGQRLACVPQPMPNAPQMGFKSSAENLLEDAKMPPPLPPLKPEWRTHMRTAQQLNGESEEQGEEAIPSDSLYGVGGGAPWRDTRPPQARPKPNLGDMSHWSSHGYLAKGGEEGPATPPHGNGYVVLKRQGDGMVTVRSPTSNSQQQQQPSSLPPITTENSGPAENKYFSVRGMRDMMNKAGEVAEDVAQTQSQKYFSVDAKFLHQHADMKNKLRENLRVSQASQKEMQAQQQQEGGGGGFYHPPAPPPNLPPYQRPPPPAHLRPQQEPKPPVASHQNNLESTKAMSGSVSWLEWTQQLQAYIAWVNSQLRKRADLKPVQDLRSDLQSGEVLAQLIEIISGEQIAGIVYQPESLQGMRENLERVLQFMASKKIRMHAITSKEVLEGNLKAVMRLILALAAHYKPQSVKHHDVSYEQMPEVKSAGASKPEAATNSEPPPAPVVPVVPPVKRSPSLNESHYSPAALRVTEPGERRLERRSRSDLPKSTVETQTQVGAPTVASPPTRGLSREGSFTRTGSGRKLPQIPDRVRSNTLPSRKNEEEKEDGEKEDTEDVADDSKKELRKPKAMEFWESMENIERNDFRYNTIHRMSMGRRLLPKPPGEAGHARSASVDRSDSSNEAEKLSLNSSFSGPTSLPVGGEVSEGEARLSPRLVNANFASTLAHKIPADGASLQSQASGNSLPLDCRGEVEGSSTNNSPPTSVIGQPGVVEGESAVWELGREKNPAYEWVRGTWDQKEESRARRKWGLPSPVTCPPGEEGVSLKGEKQVPYEVLLEDLSQAKRQLLELHSLVSSTVPVYLLHCLRQQCVYSVYSVLGSRPAGPTRQRPFGILSRSLRQPLFTLFQTIR